MDVFKIHFRVINFSEYFGGLLKFIHDVFRGEYFLHIDDFLKFILLLLHNQLHFLKFLVEKLCMINNILRLANNCRLSIDLHLENTNVAKESVRDSKEIDWLIFVLLAHEAR